jgi:galactokinase
MSSNRHRCRAAAVGTVLSYARCCGRIPRVKHFVPSSTPAEGLGVMLLFELIDGAVPAFFRGDRSIHIARAPGRLDVLGGLADHAAALVLQVPTAEAACAAVQLRDDTLVRLWSPCRDGSRTQLLSMQLAELGLPGAPIDYGEARALLGADARDHWAAHLLGCLLVLARERGVTFARGAEVLLHSDVPEQVGVGSSAAVEVAAMQAFAAAYGIPLSGPDLVQLCHVVENEVAGSESGMIAQATAAVGEADELLAVRCEPWQVVDSLHVPMDLEFVGLDTGVRRRGSATALSANGQDAHAEQFFALLQQELTSARRQQLGDLLLEAHGAYATAGRGEPTADFLIERVRERRAAGAPVYGGKLMGHGGGGAVVLLGERGKVWYEALRIKKTLLVHSGHSAHVFRWSSPGALSFGGIELRPSGA